MQIVLLEVRSFEQPCLPCGFKWDDLGCVGHLVRGTRKKGSKYGSEALPNGVIRDGIPVVVYLFTRCFSSSSTPLVAMADGESTLTHDDFYSHLQACCMSSSSSHQRLEMYSIDYAPVRERRTENAA